MGMPMENLEGDEDLTNRMAEAALTGVSNEESEFFQHTMKTESNAEIKACANPMPVRMPLPEISERNQQFSDDADALELSAERFADLGQEMMQIVSALCRSVKESENRLQTIMAEIELKKRELRTFHNIDVTAVSLKQLAQEQQEQKKQLECLIADQYSLWEEERNRIEQEELLFLENLQDQRRREEEEHRRAKDLRQREFEQELQMIRQKALARQEEKESEFFQREQVLIEKEQEIARLMRELDGFLSQLEVQGSLSESNPAESRKWAVFPKSGTIKPMQIPVNEDDNSVVIPVNEMALTLNRNMDDSHENYAAKPESTLIPFAIKKPLII
jgi:hypothetical protein